MPDITDPAEEFVLLCQNLASSSKETGAAFLSSQFDVEPWSFEFFQIIFCIVERAEQLKRLVTEIPECSHIAEHVKGSLANIAIAFQAQAMARPWTEHGFPHLGPSNTGIILGLSAHIRTKVSYPKLSPDELSEISVIASDLLNWLKDHQLNDHDFIRQAIIEGLQNFLFRLDRLQWLGWGYTLRSLRDVIGAYLALENCSSDSDPTTLMTAVNQKVFAAIKRIYSGIGATNEFVNRTDFMIKAYGAASMVLNVKSGGVIGLLTFAGSAH